MRPIAPRRATLITALMTAVLYAAFCAYTGVQARGLRRTGSLDNARELLAGELPHDVLRRYILLRPGTRQYHEELAAILADASFANTPWNRAIVDRFAAACTDEVAASLAAAYPVAPTPRFESRALALLDEGHFEVLPLLARTTRGQAAFRTWRSETLPELDEEQARLALPYLLSFGLATFQEAARSRQLDLNGQAEVLTVFLYEAAPAAVARVVPGLLGFVDLALESGAATREMLASLEEPPPVDPDSIDPDSIDPDVEYPEPPRIPLTDMFAAALSSGPAAAAPILAAIESYLNANAGNGELLKVYHLFLGIADCEVNSRSHLEVCGPDLTGTPGAEDVYVRAFERTRVAEPLAAAAIFHALAHLFPARAATVAAAVCQGPDSTAVKTVAVLAERHVFQQGCINRAFSGDAPRVAHFRSIAEYESGSEAANAYNALSGHGYTVVGKRWPPHYGTRRPAPADIAGWESFVARYRWYPATDDAYYRMAYAHLLAGHAEEARKVVQRYNDLEDLPDLDSTPFLNHLDLVARSELGEAIAEDELRKSREELWEGRRPNERQLEEAVELIDWLLRHRADVSGAVPDEAALWNLRSAVEAARAVCADEDIHPRRCELPPGAQALMDTRIQVPPQLEPSYAVALPARPAGNGAPAP